MKSQNSPRILKAGRVQGRTLAFRDTNESDAAFILSLRTDDVKSQHLNKTSPELSQQISWLKKYATRIDQAYFIIENQMGESLGTVRLYDAQDVSFCWGSWILKEGTSAQAAIESALMVYAYAVDQLDFRASHFDVRKSNERVWRFHERFGAERVGQTKDDYLYQISPNQISLARQRYKKYLPLPLTVEQ